MLFAFSTVSLSGQITTKNKLIPSEIGFAFVLGNEHNFLFDDPDYNYQSKIVKLRLHYPLLSKSNALTLIFEPQVVHLSHQLINEHFVTPDEDKYMEKRVRFTRKKQMTLAVIETTLAFKVKIYKKLSGVITAGLGLGYIDTATERLTKGFTFTENSSIALEHTVKERTNLYIAIGLGHVSNFNFKLPNSGYNTLTTAIGFSYILK